MNKTPALRDEQVSMTLKQALFRKLWSPGMITVYGVSLYVCWIPNSSFDKTGYLLPAFLILFVVLPTLLLEFISLWLPTLSFVGYGLLAFNLSGWRWSLYSPPLIQRVQLSSGELLLFTVYLFLFFWQGGHSRRQISIQKKMVTQYERKKVSDKGKHG